MPEQPSTYFVQDRENKEELTRVRIQDHMLTAGMGGHLSEQSDPARFHSVLDIGCGTGGWLITAAQAFPSMKRLVGVDISMAMVTYAREQAIQQGVSDRVTFESMDALRMLEFPNHSFDLVNERFAWSYMRTWDWPKLISEMKRVTRTGGVLRLTESDIVTSTSPALNQLGDLLLQTAFAAGHFQTPDRDSVLHLLPTLLTQQSLREIQVQEYILTYRSGTPEGEIFYEDIRHAYRTFLPFFQKWIRVDASTYEALYQQALVEMKQPDFQATWNLLTAWGRV